MCGLKRERETSKNRYISATTAQKSAWHGRAGETSLSSHFLSKTLPRHCPYIA
jgi:hypothetical protein